MPILPWACAHGEPPPVTLRCASTVDIAPPDDSVDTNAIIIEGFGEIDTFGLGPGGFIRKRIVFRPTAPELPDHQPAGGGAAPTITIRHNPPWLMTVTGNNRIVRDESYAEYVCNDSGHWFELYFTATGAMAFENRINELEQRLIELERKLSKRSRKPTEE